MKPVRVLLTVPHLSETAYPYREMMALAKYLPRDEFTLTVCALRPNGSETTGPRLEGLGISHFEARFRPTGRSTRHVKSALRAQLLMAKRGPFDIQHSMDFTSSPFEALCAKAARRRFIRHQSSFNENGHPRMLKVVLGCADRTIAISESVTRFLSGLGVPCTKVCGGFDVQEFPSESVDQPARRPGFFLAVGHVQRRKRQEDAIKALARVVGAGVDVRLGIAGTVFDRGYADELGELADQLGISSRVEFLGPRTDIPQLMQHAEAVLLCSDSEAFGYVVVEAMAAGVPVIASRSGGPEEIVVQGETGFLVPIGDIDGYASAMRAVATQPELRAQFGRLGRRRVEEHFSARGMVDRFAAVYRASLAERRRFPFVSI